MSETRQFLEALFADKPEGSFVLLWTFPEKKSFFCASVNEAVATVERIKGASCVYAGLGLSDQNYGYKLRCKSSQVAGIPGVWLDLDIADAGAHKKGNLPACREDVLALLEEAGLPPTMSVNSGHGLQCYWLFKKLWVLKTAEQRQEAETLCQHWNYTVRHLARQRGWDVDSTFDLARVFRVPGTTNRKVKDHPVPVSIIGRDGRRYSQTEIRAALIGGAPEPRAKGAKEYDGAIISDDLTLDPNASVEADLITALTEFDAKFGLSWERKRKDMPDQTGSSYDMSLATIAANAGCDDQTIVNLLINHRRKHKDDLKLRLGYYRGTLKVARRGITRNVSMDTLQEMLHEQVTEVAEPDPFTEVDAAAPASAPAAVAGSSNEPAPKPAKSITPEAAARRNVILAHCSELLGFEITRIVKYISSEPSYRIETPDGGIMLGGVAGLIRQEALRNQVAALTGYYMPKFKPALWDTMAQSLLRSVEDQSAGAEATDEGLIRSYVRSYLADNPPAEAGLTEDVVTSMAPYRSEKNAKLYLFAGGLAMYLKAKYGEALGHKRLGTLLRLHGAEPYVTACNVKGKTTTRSVWALPYDDPEGE